jgi:carbonic anhydrase
MNISPNVIVGKCNSKCSYSYNYPTSSSTATNDGNAINISYNQSPSSVNYNNKVYDVTSCYILSPSLHLYNNLVASGEFIIVHTPSSGGNSLYVCIPISTNGVSSSASNTLSQIIMAVDSSAPSQGETVTQGIDDFTLNEFIPNKPFYSYSTDTMDVIAFGIQTAIFISQENLAIIHQCISSSIGNIFPSDAELFISTKNPTLGSKATSNEIYIDCQPTNQSEEQVNTVELKQPITYTPISLKGIIKSPIFIIVISSLLFVVIIVIIQKLISLLGGESIQFSSMKSVLGNATGSINSLVSKIKGN